MRISQLFCVLLALSAHVLAEERILLDSPVKLVTSNEPEMFPESWRAAPISAEGGILTEVHAARLAEIIKREAGKYPAELLKKELKQVYGVSKLRYFGVSTGGTNSFNAVYVRVGDVKEGFTTEHIASVFHAEFSSILLRNHAKKFDTAAWEKVNPPGFKYLGNGVDAIKQNKAGKTAKAEQFEQGFLSEYGKSSVENDFNGWVALLFSGDAQKWETVDKYPKLAAKKALAVAFYQQLHPVFTEEYFRAFAKVE